MIRTLLAALTTLTLLQVAAPARAEAPEKFNVKFETTAGDFTVAVTRRLAPKGADRFHALVESGFYDGARFFRVVPRFVVQFGITGDPKVQKKWREDPITDDPVKFTNRKGTLTFATAGPNTRTTQLFININDNTGLDRQGFAPFGEVTEGMQNVLEITGEYGEKPNQGLIQSQGNAYLEKNFPKLDYIKKATVVEE